MMSAEETRQYQQKIYDDRAEQELTEIEAKIGAAIMGGKYEISVSKHFSKTAVKKLIELGYDVKEESSQREGDWTYISWYKKG